MLSSEKKVGPSEPSVAILVDAENTPHALIGNILDTSARFGRTIIRRAYADWGVPVLSPWRDVFKEYPITAIQQFHYVSGKNSSDSAMMIDAMDILREKKIDVFILVTSDSDFTKLAIRVREDGIRVIGMGAEKVPRSFVNACDEFVSLESLQPLSDVSQTSDSPSDSKVVTQKNNGKVTTKKNAQKPPAAKVSSSFLLGDEQRKNGKELLVKAATAGVDENGIILGSHLGIILKRIDPAFSPRAYGVSRLTFFIGLYPEILVPTGEKLNQGDPLYKLVDSKDQPTT